MGGKATKRGILDENGRFFGRLNIIDLTVFVMVAVLVLAIAYRFTSSAMTKQDNCRVRYTLLIEGVRELSLEYYEEGLSCFDKLKQEYIGNIVAVRSEPLDGPVTQLDGSVVMAAQPDRLRLYVDIESDARETASAFLLNGAYELKVGSQINLNTRYIDVWGFIVSAEIIE